jgi:tellurite resistance protein TerC
VPHFGFPVEAIIIFLSVVGLSVYLDLFAHRKSTEITLSDSVRWSFWVALALAFYGYLWVRFSKEWADLYLAGYALEKSLSIDNLMVFMAIFASFGIRACYNIRILYYGIIGALVFRAIFRTHWHEPFPCEPMVGFLFAAFVIWSGIKMLQAAAVTVMNLTILQSLERSCDGQDDACLRACTLTASSFATMSCSR